MDIDLVRSLITVLAFTAFVGVVAWAYSGARRREFENASRLPFAHEAAELPAANDPT